jgi:hypothetical protein
MAKFYASGPPTRSEHEIWHPHPAAYEKENLNAAAPMSMPEPTIPSFSNPDDSWRAYPPFPSAYPSTPARHSGIPIPQPTSEYNDSDRPGFRQSLLPPREPDPSSDGDLSDEIHDSGVQDYFQPTTLDNANDENIYNDHNDSDYVMEDDSFDITLRTPYALRSRPEVAHRAQPAAISREPSNTSIITATTVASSSGTDSMDSGSILTGLSTVRHAPTLRTTTSVASTASDSDTTSMLSRKRRLSGSAPDSVSSSPDSDVSKPTKTPRRRVVRARTASVRREATKVVSLRPRCERISSKETPEQSAASGLPSAASKRRRLAHPPKPARPATRGNAVGATVARKALKIHGTTAARAPTATPSRSSLRISAHVAAAAPAPSRLPRATVAAKPSWPKASVVKLENGQACDSEPKGRTSAI